DEGQHGLVRYEFTLAHAIQGGCQGRGPFALVKSLCGAENVTSRKMASAQFLAKHLRLRAFAHSWCAEENQATRPVLLVGRGQAFGTSTSEPRGTISFCVHRTLKLKLETACFPIMQTTGKTNRRSRVQLNLTCT